MAAVDLAMHVGQHLSKPNPLHVDKQSLLDFLSKSFMA